MSEETRETKKRAVKPRLERQVFNLRGGVKVTLEYPAGTDVPEYDASSRGVIVAAPGEELPRLGVLTPPAGRVAAHVAAETGSAGWVSRHVSAATEPRGWNGKDELQEIAGEKKEITHDDFQEHVRRSQERAASKAKAQKGALQMVVDTGMGPQKIDLAPQLSSETKTG